MRLYSIASARDGEKPNAGNLAIAVKRVVGAEALGVASNWICDLRPGEEVDVFGPFGSTFLMPDDPEAHILRICTGTGVAPFRGFTHRRRRTWPNASGKLVLIYGARTPDELPYYQPLQKYSQDELHRELVYSRGLIDEHEYVQDRLRRRAREVRWFLRQPKAYIYICGIRDLDTFVDEALNEITVAQGINWTLLKTELCNTGRYHVETY
jgi:benzoyl-CoA 2,3-dioxygenase component A